MLVNTRLAADAVGATKMDRPEWAAVNSRNGEVYFTLTNNAAAQRPITAVDAANPRFYNDKKTTGQDQKGNPNGHVIRWVEGGGYVDALSFDWDVYLFGARATASPDNVNLSGLTDANDFSSPDGAWFSYASPGLLWLQTDDGAYTDVTNCMMLAALPGRTGDGEARTITNVDGANSSTVTTFVGKNGGEKKVRRFLVGPKECEITGIAETPDGRALFVNIQHPGEATAPNFATGAFGSHWPDGGVARPRSATIVITRDDGGVIGVDNGHEWGTDLSPFARKRGCPHSVCGDFAHVVADVLLADLCGDAGGIERLAQVGVNSTQQHVHVPFLQPPDDLAQRVEAGRIHERHAAEPQHDGLDAELQRAPACARASRRRRRRTGRRCGTPARCAAGRLLRCASSSNGCCSTRTVSAMRRMNSSAASTTPTLTATTRSTNTVSTNVTISSRRSARGAVRSRRTTCGASAMFQATKNRMAASAASGMCAAQGASTRITSTSNSACTTPATGLVAPLRMLVAVRAMAPVAAKPPNSGVMILATPWPMSSWLESCRVPVMPSATTAVSSDSMAPNKAMAKAGPTSCR